MEEVRSGPMGSPPAVSGRRPCASPVGARGSSGEGDVNSTGKRPSEPAAAGVKRTRRRLTGVRSLIVLVAACGLITWAARVVWENRNLDLVEERAVLSRALLALDSGKAGERVGAVQALA